MQLGGDQDFDLQGCCKNRSMLGMDIDRDEDYEFCFFFRCEILDKGKMYKQYYFIVNEKVLEL